MVGTVSGTQMTVATMMMMVVVVMVWNQVICWEVQYLKVHSYFQAQISQSQEKKMGMN